MPRRNTTASSNGTAATEAPAAAPANGDTMPPAQPAAPDAPKPAAAPTTEQPEAVKAKPAPIPAPSIDNEIVARTYGAIVDEPNDNAAVVTATRQLTSGELRMLLTLLESSHAEARFKAADPSFKGYQRTLRAIASQLALELDARYGLRKEIGQENGHGVYVEAGPLGTVGVGLGHVRRRKLSNGSTKAAHTGLGVYCRLNVFTKAEVSSSNRLEQLADMARKAAAAATAAA